MRMAPMPMTFTPQPPAGPPPAAGAVPLASLAPLAPLSPPATLAPPAAPPIAPPVRTAASAWWIQAAIVVALHAAFLVFEGTRTDPAKSYVDALHWLSVRCEWMTRQLPHVALVVLVLQIGDRWLPRSRRRTLSTWLALALAAPLGAAGALLVLPFEPVQVRMGSSASSGVLFWYWVWANLLVTVLLLQVIESLRRRQQAARQLAGVQEQSRIVREQLASAQLLAIQARVDPQFLFDMLAEVKRAYGQDVARAERLLDELSDFLRSALPRLRSANSTLEVELELVRRYAGLLGATGPAAIEMQERCPLELAKARFPAGVLLPIFSAGQGAQPGKEPVTDASASAALPRPKRGEPRRGVLRSGVPRTDEPRTGVPRTDVHLPPASAGGPARPARQMAVDVWPDAGALHVQLSDTAGLAEDRIERMRASLGMLYGEAAVVRRQRGPRGEQLMLEVPLEFA